MNSYKKKETPRFYGFADYDCGAQNSGNREDFAATVLKVMHMQIIEFDGRCFSQ